MKYKRIKLPFSYDFLEPYMDTKTVDLHYNVHHKGYEDKLNKFIQNEDNLTKKYPDLIQLMKNYQSIEDRELKIAIREFGGGLVNHNFFWQILRPNVKLEDGPLKKDIEKKWESFEAFQQNFEKESLSLFGSGWVWLAKKNNGDLKIIKTFNQDNPWFLGFKPIIGIDLWEHSYYLKHNGNKANYLKDFWNIIDWKKAEENYLN